MVFAGVIIKGFYEESTKSCATSQGDLNKRTWVWPEANKVQVRQAELSILEGKQEGGSTSNHRLLLDQDRADTSERAGVMS